MSLRLSHTHIIGKFDFSFLDQEKNAKESFQKASKEGRTALSKIGVGWQNGPWRQSPKVLQFSKVPRWQCSKVPRWQSSKVPQWQFSKVPRWQISKVPRWKISKVPRWWQLSKVPSVATNSQKSLGEKAQKVRSGKAQKSLGRNYDPEGKVAGQATKKPKGAKNSPSPLLEGRQRCVETVESVQEALRNLAPGKKEDEQNVNTVLQNIWFLQAIANADTPNQKYPKTTTVIDSSGKSDVRPLLIQRHKRCSQLSQRAKRSAFHIDCFVNQMVTTGLDLFWFAQDVLVQFLLFISELPILKSLVDAASVCTSSRNECTKRILSMAYLHAHFILTSCGFGELEDCVSVSPIRPALEGSVEYLVVCLNELTQSDLRIKKNLEIILEIHWVLLLVRRYSLTFLGGT